MYRTVVVCCVLIVVIPETFEQRYLDRLRQWIQPPTINYKDQLLKFNLTKQIHVHKHQHHHHHHKDNATRVKPNYGEHHHGDHSKMVDHHDNYYRPRHHHHHHPHHYHHNHQHHKNHSYHHQRNMHRKNPQLQKNPLGNVINDYQLVTNSNDNEATEQVTTPTTINNTNQTEISTEKLPEVETTVEELQKQKNETQQQQQQQTVKNSYEVTESAEDQSKENEVYEIGKKIKENIEAVNKTGKQVKTNGKSKIKVLFDLNDILK